MFDEIFFFFFYIPVSNIGNVYIADTSNNRIRKVTESTGIISTIAGSSTSASYSGDNGAATSATLSNPVGVALDASGRILYYCPLHRYTVSSAMFDEIFLFIFYIPLSNIGNVYIADQGNNRIRKVTVSTGIITTIAGTGGQGYSGDNGAATSATLYYPWGVALDASGRIL